MSDRSTTRRGFVRLAGASAAVGATAGTAAGQDDRPDFGGYLDGIDGGFADARGEADVRVMVGAEGNGSNFAFEPAGLWIDPGTTVTWEWTGEGGAHNVVADTEDGPEPAHPDLDSGETVDEEGHTYEFTFEEEGITPYVCVPHRAAGMVGAVAVGDVGGGAERRFTATDWVVAGAGAVFGVALLGLMVLMATEAEE